MPENGVLQIYTANETANQNVWFDDLKVTFSPQLIVQENHYYPFGLELAGLNKRGKPEHRWTFNEVSEKTYEPCDCPDGVGKGFVYETKYRQLDPQLGRWRTIDPKADTDYLVSQSPYSSMDNNPILKNDPNGDCPICPVIIAALFKGVVSAGTELGTQMLANGMQGKPIYDIDVADIGVAFVSGLFVPGSNKIVNVGKVAVAETVKAGVDIKTVEGTKTIFGSGKNQKKLSEAAIDLVAGPGGGGFGKTTKIITEESIKSSNKILKKELSKLNTSLRRSKTGGKKAKELQARIQVLESRIAKKNKKASRGGKVAEIIGGAVIAAGGDQAKDKWVPPARDPRVSQPVDNTRVKKKF